MNNTLLAEILKAQDNLQTIEFELNKVSFKWFFKYLTLLEKVRIEQMCVKPKTTIKEDGTSMVEYEKQDHLIPIHTILEKALDKDGKRLFSHTNPKDFEAISKLPAGIASYIAYQMQSDILGNLKGISDGN